MQLFSRERTYATTPTKNGNKRNQMTDQIGPGDSLIIARDVKIGDVLAFRKGEQVVVESVSPNPTRPEFKYVVYSQTSNKRYQLSDADLSKSQQHAPDIVATPQGVPKMKATKEDNRLKKGLIGIAVAVLVLGLVFLLVYQPWVGRKSEEGISESAPQKSSLQVEGTYKGTVLGDTVELKSDGTYVHIFLGLPGESPEVYIGTYTVTEKVGECTSAQDDVTYKTTAEIWYTDASGGKGSIPYCYTEDGDLVHKAFGLYTKQ